MALAFTFLTSIVKRLNESSILLDDTNPLFNVLEGLADGLDEMSERVMIQLEALDWDKATGDDLDNLGSRINLPRTSGESDADYRARGKIFLPTARLSGSLEFVNKVVKDFSGSLPTLTKNVHVEFLELPDEEDFLFDVQAQQDAVGGCELDDEADFASLQIQQDTGSTDCVLVDEDFLDNFLLNIDAVLGAYDFDGLRTTLFDGKSHRDIYAVTQS